MHYTDIKSKDKGNGVFAFAYSNISNLVMFSFLIYETQRLNSLFKMTLGENNNFKKA